MQTELRKHQHTLITYGTGTILFGLWSLAKSVVYLVIDRSENSLYFIIDQLVEPDDKKSAFLIAIAAVSIVFLIDMIFRWVAGSSARKIGTGMKIKPGFVIASLYIVAVDGFEFVSGIQNIIAGEFMQLDKLLTLLVDITSFIIVLQMIYAAFMVGKLSKAIELEGAAAAGSGK